MNKAVKIWKNTVMASYLNNSAQIKCQMCRVHTNKA